MTTLKKAKVKKSDDIEWPAAMKENNEYHIREKFDLLCHEKAEKAIKEIKGISNAQLPFN